MQLPEQLSQWPLYVANASVEYMTIDPDRELGSGGGYPIEYFATTESVVDLLSIQIGFFLRI